MSSFLYKLTYFRHLKLKIMLAIPALNAVLALANYHTISNLCIINSRLQ